jgi:hypothetical protein
MTPTTGRRGLGWLRQCHALQPLWGENSAVAVRFDWKLLLKPQAHPFAAFG